MVSPKHHKYKTSFMCCNSFPTFSRNQNTSDLDLGSRQVDTTHTYLHTYQLVWSPVDCSLTVGVNSETHYKILIKAKKNIFRFEPYGVVQFNLAVVDNIQ